MVSIFSVMVEKDIRHYDDGSFSLNNIIRFEISGIVQCNEEIVPDDHEVVQ
jgi:hypothetical protein